MKPDDVERLLERFIPDAAPAGFRETVLGEARKRLLRQAPPRPASPRMRMAGIFAVAGSLLIAAGIFRVILFPGTASAPGEGSSVSPQEEKKALDLVKRLADDEPETRENAERALKAMGHGISGLLRKELQRTQDPELRARLQRVLDDLTLVSLERVKEIDFGDKGYPNQVAWRPDGKEIALSALKKYPELATTIRFFGTETGTRRGQIELPGHVRRMAYSPNGRLLGVRHNSGLEIYDSVTLRKLAVLPLEEDINIMSVGLLQFLDNDQLIFASPTGTDDRLQIATLHGGKLTAEVKGKGHYFDMAGLVCSPDSAWLAYQPHGGSMTYDLVNMRSWQKMPALTSKPAESQRALPENDLGRHSLTGEGWRGCAFSGDSKYLFLQSLLGELVVYQAGTWQRVHWLDFGGSCFFDVMADDRFLVTARNSEPVLRAWRWDTGKEVGLTTLLATEKNKVIGIQACPGENLICVLAESSPAVWIYRLKEKP
jgi:hypothetical protein